MYLAIGLLVCLFTKNIYHEIENRTSLYESKIISCVIFMDPSNEGSGWFILTNLNNQILSCKIQGLWKTYKFNPKRITCRLNMFWIASEKCYESVQANIDNSSASWILSVGYAKPHLQNITIDVYTFCSKFSIKLIHQWIPREQNGLANYYSRMKDTDNWSIDNDSRRLIINCYGPFTVDRFPSFWFYKRYYFCH